MAADLGNVNVAPAFCSNFNIPNNESRTRCCSLERKVDKLQGELLSVLEIIILQHQGEVPICRPNCSTAKEESSLETLGWTIATGKKGTKANNSREFHHTDRQPFPVIVNRYEVLQSQQEKESVVQRKNENGGKCKQRSLPSTKKRTVTVIGDSHARGCAENIKILKTRQREGDVIEGTADRGDSAEEGEANKRTADRGDSTEEDDANKGTTDRGDSAEEDDV
ncbi:hypothetical protein ANN_14068, partial [Periplaneta americana]